MFPLATATVILAACLASGIGTTVAILASCLATGIALGVVVGEALYSFLRRWLNGPGR